LGGRYFTWFLEARRWDDGRSAVAASLLATRTAAVAPAAPAGPLSGPPSAAATAAAAAAAAAAGTTKNAFLFARKVQ